VAIAWAKHAELVLKIIIFDKHSYLTQPYQMIIAIQPYQMIIFSFADF